MQTSCPVVEGALLFSFMLFDRFFYFDSKKWHVLLFIHTSIILMGPSSILTRKILMQWDGMISKCVGFIWHTYPRQSSTTAGSLEQQKLLDFASSFPSSSVVFLRAACSRPFLLLSRVKRTLIGYLNELFTKMISLTRCCSCLLHVHHVVNYILHVSNSFKTNSSCKHGAFWDFCARLQWSSGLVSLARNTLRLFLSRLWAVWASSVLFCQCNIATTQQDCTVGQWSKTT